MISFYNTICNILQMKTQHLVYSTSGPEALNLDVQKTAKNECFSEIDEDITSDLNILISEQLE